MLDERARHELYRAVEELLGTERADTLMNLLPPVGWADVATKDDVRQLEARLESGWTRRLDVLEARWDSRLDALVASTDRLFAEREARCDARSNGLDSHLSQLEAGIDARFARAEARTDARFAVVDARFENVDARFARLDTRFAQLEGQLDRSLREQTRTLMLGLVGTVFTVTSLYLGAVAFAP